MYQLGFYEYGASIAFLIGSLWIVINLFKKN
jgi:hypothetical protein